MLAVGLVPMVRAVGKPPLSTSIPTALVLWVFVLAYLSLGLVLSGVVGGISAGLWTVLVVQAVGSGHGDEQ